MDLRKVCSLALLLPRIEFEKEKAMYLDVIVLLLIAVGIPRFTAVAFLGIAKKR
jgi:hypothetical protein